LKTVNLFLHVGFEFAAHFIENAHHTIFPRLPLSLLCLFFLHSTYYCLTLFYILTYWFTVFIPHQSWTSMGAGTCVVHCLSSAPGTE
jgi:hypothetical protein